MVSEVDLAYIAGIVDGEGCLQLYQHYMSRGNFTPMLSITNTSWKLIDWINEIFPGGSIDYRTYESYGRLNNKPRIQWRICSNKCIDMLGLIRPYLFLKVEHADNLLAFWRIKQSYGIRSGKRAPEAYVSEASVIKDAIHVLNYRGVSKN